MTTDSSLAEQWTRFLERLASRNERLTDTLAACSGDLRSFFEEQFREAKIVTTADLDPPDLAVFQKARDEAARKLLRKPVSQWERGRSYSRAYWPSRLTTANWKNWFEACRRVFPSMGLPCSRH